MTDAASSAGDPLAHVPEGPVPSSQEGRRLLDLVRVMARLRGPGGCPWDAEQTHRTLARHLLEETHELLEAIDADDDDAIREELGDVLLQVVFHAQMAADEGRWDIDDVAEGLVGDQHAPRGGRPQPLVWSADGRSLIVVTAERGRANLQRFDVATGKATPVTTGDHGYLSGRADVPKSAPRGEASQPGVTDG